MTEPVQYDKVLKDPARAHVGLVDSPMVVMERLATIERDLAFRQNNYERAAGAWFEARREQEREHAKALLASAAATVTEKKAHADIASYGVDGAEYEAEYEAIRAVLKVLETRAMILMALLKAQGRA